MPRAPDRPGRNPGRAQSWAPTSVREVLFRDVYRRTTAWNRTRKRNKWGLHSQTARPASEWLAIPAPALRIVPEDLWTAVRFALECEYFNGRCIDVDGGLTM